ncbi:MAG TPA: polysaccharide deacetylase family protein [Bryobacteraceae bacterium]|nr:polysaccharide deacetylase family protein [Bryobacteraceae bacterium]
MKALALMYHDVVENGNFAASGFPGPGADRYKLDRLEFVRHLRAIKEAVGNQPVLLTFDDGGVSAHERIAGMLEEFGWRGHFFVTTDWIGRPGFLNTLQIQELDRHGHTVGSHSATHPVRMSQIPWDQMLSEWRDSRAQLENIVGHPVECGSVPGGYYSRKVAQAAEQSGIRTLFTSEPTARIQMVDSCQVLGRYVVLQGMGPEWSAGFASGRTLPRLRQALLWKTKQTAKVLSGGLYLRAREAILRKA